MWQRADVFLLWMSALPILCEKKVNKKTNQQWGVLQESKTQGTNMNRLLGKTTLPEKGAQGI